MSISTILRAAVWPGLLLTGMLAPKASAEPPAVPLVEVEMRPSDGGAATTSTGIVWPGGGVLVRLKWIEDAVAASIRGADGAEHASPGVLTYQTEAGTALLAVDWGGEAPPGAEIAVEAPRPGDHLWLQFIDHGERGVLRADVRSLQPLKFLIGLEENPAAERIAGGPLVNEAGAIVGMPSGVRLGTSIAPIPNPGPAAPVNGYIALIAVRCEALRAIKAGPLITWTDWAGTTVPNIRQARKLVDDASALYWEGQAEPDAIVQSLQRAVELDPQNPAAWRMLADSLCTSSQYQPAVDAAARAIALAVTDGPAYTTASWALYHLGRVDGAISAAEHAIELKHDLGGNYWRLGCYLWKQKRGDEAVTAFKNCLAQDPQSERAKKLLAEALRQLGRDEEARQYE